MKTLKQLQVEHVANILLTAMEKQAACLELLCDEIADGNIPFCKGRKLLKSGIERCDRAILGVENFYYNTNKQ